MTNSAELDVLVEELLVDAYGDEEQLAAFVVAVEEALEPPEPATIVGVGVEVIGIDCGPGVRTGLAARVRRAATLYEVALLDLDFQADSAVGLVAAAYRRWLGR
jgi:hypothetical protein